MKQFLQVLSLQNIDENLSSVYTCEASIPPKIHGKNTLLLCINGEVLYTWLFFLQKILSSKALCGDLESAQLKVFQR